MASDLDYKHEIIYFNNGLHGLSVPIEVFEASLIDKVEYLLNYTKTLVLATCTPITEKDNPSVLAPENSVVTKRNEVIRRVAKKYNLPLNDWYEFVLSCPFYKLKDGRNYTEEGKRIMAKLVCDILSKLL